MIRFVIVGCLGFLINVVFLTLFYKELDIPLLVSQLMAAEIAILSNFNLHNRWTYDDARTDSVKKRIIEFHASSWSGSIITTVILVGLKDWFNVNYLIALTAGGIVAMFWNYFWTRFYIWKSKDPVISHES